MKSLFIANGAIDMPVPDTAFIQHELDWLQNLIDGRLRAYFGHDSNLGSELDSPGQDHFWYSQFFRGQRVTVPDKILLWLSVSPVLRPQLLDCFYVKNQEIDNRFSEFGAYRPTHLNALVPTLDTLLFILCADDVEKRIYYLNHFFLFPQYTC